MHQRVSELKESEEKLQMMKFTVDHAMDAVAWIAPEFICSSRRDITELRQAENEIKQYKRIVESTNNPIGLVDRNFIYQYVNEPYCQALKT